MLPFDIVLRIRARGVEMLRRAVVDAVTLSTRAASDVTKSSAVIVANGLIAVDDVENRPGQREHRMLLAFDLSS